MIQVLLVENSLENDRLLQDLQREIDDSVYCLEKLNSLSLGLERLMGGDVDLVLLDMALLDGQSLDTVACEYPQLASTGIIALVDAEFDVFVLDTPPSGVLDYLVKKDLDGRTLAKIIRYAIQQRRMEDVLKRRTRHLDMLNRASQAFASSLNLNEVLSSILEELRRDLGATYCAIWLVDPETKELICEHSTGQQDDQVRGWRLPPGQGIAGWVAVSDQSAHVPDTRLDDRHFKAVGQEGGLELRSNLTVPLRVKDEVIGVVQVVDTEPNRFSGIDLELVETLAPSAAIAIDNARLYQETERLAAFNEDIVQGMEGGITLEDTHGHVAFVNPKMANLLGYAPEDLRGRHWRSMVAPEELTRVEAESATRVHGLASRYETSLLCANGGRVPLMISAKPVFEGNEFKGVLSVFTDITERKRAERALAQLNEELEQRVDERTRELALAHDSALEGWARALELRDHGTEGHSRRVTKLTVRLAEAVGVSGEDLENVRRGAVLHDIGKIGVPDQILLKPGPLTEDEWETMRQHPVHARAMLMSIGFLRPALDIPYCHHEKWDGTGYPRGLNGKEIPLAARIFAIVDVWDALLSGRPYRAPMSVPEAIKVIKQSSGTHFQPEMVEVFLEILDEDKTEPDPQILVDNKSGFRTACQ